MSLAKNLAAGLLSLPALAIVLLLAVTAAAQPNLGSYVTTTEAQVRRGPGSNYEVVATIPRDVKIQVVGREGSWLKIESKHGNKPGYIDGRFARPLQAQQTHQSKSVASAVAGPYRTLYETVLRDGPGMNYQVITRLPVGIKVTVVRAEGDWLRVESKHGDRPGYVDRKSVERWTNR